ncbi:50S ribosomal protein L18 [Candidatus Woesebacteria bacterium]|nr:50S ribosomal protein L18 [Candidatus Woesebacteria bacterium]
MKDIIKRRKKRARRTRSKICGTAQKPRLSVFRSNRFTYVQAIDDVARKTIFAFGSKTSKEQKGTKTEIAMRIGEEAGALLKKKKITSVIFDRGPYLYNGRVKAVAEGLRKAGINV